GDWKTAWDLIDFQGFLGVRMTMQFTWQGCDSVLAAPLVIDLVRLADLALRRGESGPMTQAACFFKAPVGTQEQELGRQYAMLDSYLRRCRIAALAGGKLPPSLHRSRPVVGDDRERSRKALRRRLGSDHPQRPRPRIREGGRIQRARLRHRGRAPVQV